ncbi:BspA family leucine-rich repeat surface protein [Enterococcus hulanensis]|uniref:BspA family leucine-rich repeat surface protein n=1 Tax=Enterococcus hulanensis TaxID=2559929 RepID=A0ABU3F1I9_9ENTE|nr:BspA family leucine-rich repeat surface protein [Enterococcus hulanensis]MDT2600975.1 BspA family leucine-rich repeat surface protein [Enterococcus hulanensis]MDT2611564.1 BspA family leucine-rich repeat surface protein [Enterococcus hulanensis]MDT2617952.1 BspA family leucine-rich repeat surface protein [Enterococcus hulanensis]MDT2628955.1 BspA family leucine-rich repeat surface protein [Enterococcus hulanensis]MDT2656517.1 BspA family leucine-rich repeat surface protein [Enterococcus hul
MIKKEKKIFILFLTSIISLSLLTPTINASVENTDSTDSQKTETSSSILESISGINSTDIIENTSQTESSNEPNTSPSHETTTDENFTAKPKKNDTDDISDGDSKKLAERYDEKSSIAPTLEEVKKYWEVSYIDNTYKNITLTKYKRDAPNDVVIPGAVIVGADVYDVFIRFTSATTSDPSVNDNTNNPSLSIWEQKFTGGTCSITSVTTNKYNNRGPIAVGSMDYAFSQGTSATDTSSKSTFTQLKKLHLENLQVYNVTSMSAMIQNAPILTYVNVSDWDVSNVTDMSATFYKNPNLETIVGLQTWKPIKVEDLSYFFGLDWSLTEQSIKPIENWFTAKDFPKNLKSMEYMFTNNTLLTSLDLSNEGWVKASSQITNLTGTFSENGFITTIKLDGWNLENIENLNKTFSNTPLLTSLTGLEQSRMPKLTSMKETFSYCGLEVINLASFAPTGSVVTDKTFFSPTTKKLLIINGETTNKQASVFKAYGEPIKDGLSKFQSDNREKFEFPYLDANGGKFDDGNQQKHYINGIVQSEDKILPEKNERELTNFKLNNTPLKEGYIFKRWEPNSLNPALSPNQISSFVDSRDVISYNKNSIYFKAVWESDKPSTGPDNEIPNDSKDDLDIAYFPKNFSFSETKLSDNGNPQLIPIKKNESKPTPQYNIGVRDYSKETNGWELTAQLRWDTKPIPGSSIQTSNNKGEVRINKNTQTSFDPNLILPQPESEKNPVLGVANLEITTTASKVMEAKPSIQNKTFDYDLGTVTLKIANPSIVSPGTYNGNVNWNLSVVPKL